MTVSNPDVNAIRDYYNQVTPEYLDCHGPTLQGAILAEHSFTESNQALGRLAGIQPGNAVLDAGCGVGQPAIDIARAIPDISLKGVTISTLQASLARQRVQDAGLGNAIEILEADFHQLPFESGFFDVVLFFESAIYSPDPLRLFAESRRVLKPGGALFIKDMFVRKGALSAYEMAALIDFNRVFVCQARSSDEVLVAIRRSGFTDGCVTPLRISTAEYERAMVERDVDGNTRLSALGRLTFSPYQREKLLQVAAIKARKPI